MAQEKFALTTTTKLFDSLDRCDQKPNLHMETGKSKTKVV